MSVKTLRYYDGIGLLIPDRVDCFTGYRYYSSAKLADCYRIAALKELGFSLEEIGRHMSADSDREVMSLLEEKEGELKSLVAETNKKIKRLESIKQILTKGEKKMFDVIVRNSESVRIVFQRKIFNSREEAYEIAEEMKKSLPKSFGAGRLIIVNYETEHREESFDLAACVELESGGKSALKEGYEYKELSFSDETASLICSKEELDAAYVSMYEQLNEKKAQITGAFYEFYHEGGTVELKVPICLLSEEENRGDEGDPAVAFENDEEMIGKWEYLDRVPSYEQFNINRPKNSRRAEVWLKEIYFLPKGEGYWIMDSWTKGSFVTVFNYPLHKYRHRCFIREVNGTTLLFVEMKDDYNVISHGGKPEICVYRKVSDRAYSKEEIGIKDNLELPFIEDKRVLGRWRAVDFVHDRERFDPFKPFRDKSWLHAERLEFSEGGKLVCGYSGGAERRLEYTEGKILNRDRGVCEEYEIREVEGREYLFCQWKSGDYVYGGRIAGDYVFVRQ